MTMIIVIMVVIMMIIMIYDDNNYNGDNDIDDDDCHDNDVAATADNTVDNNSNYDNNNNDNDDNDNDDSNNSDFEKHNPDHLHLNQINQKMYGKTQCLIDLFQFINQHNYPNQPILINLLHVEPLVTERLIEPMHCIASYSSSYFALSVYNDGRYCTQYNDLYGT